MAIKLTESRLRGIIREELEGLREARRPVLDPVVGHLRNKPWLLLDPGVKGALKAGLRSLPESDRMFVVDMIRKLEMDDPGKRQRLLGQLKPLSNIDAELDLLPPTRWTMRPNIETQLRDHLSKHLADFLDTDYTRSETSKKIAAFMAQALEEIERERALQGGRTAEL